MIEGKILSRLALPALLALAALVAVPSAGAQGTDYCASPPPGVPDGYYCPSPPPDDDDDDGGGGGGDGGGGGGGDGGGSAGRQCAEAVGKVTRKGVGRFRLGAERQKVKSDAGAPPRREAKDELRFCVKGGGYIGVAFERRRAAAIVVAAQGYKLSDGIRIGDAKRSLPKKVKRVKGDVYRLDTAIIGMRRGFVNYIGVADKSLLKSKRRLLKAVKNARG